MKAFDYANIPKILLTPEIVSMLTCIHEHKGKQDLFVEAHADALTALLEVAKIQSTGASNRIEGINTTDKRLKELVREKAEPRNRSEQEIAGYRHVLNTIHESYEYIPPKPDIILQLHRDLYSFSSHASGGKFKSSDNFISETDGEGNTFTRFQPTPAYQTPEAMTQMCSAFIQAIERDEHDALLLIPLFILDFLCIHPFHDGNGRMSRLLTLLLFYRAGYIVGKYISLEKLIENSKDTYYEALRDSSGGWHENTNAYAPFIRYYLGLLIKAYNEFEERVEDFSQKGLTKAGGVKAVVERKIGKITKDEILETRPDISVSTVERALSALIKEGKIMKIGEGRAAAYVKTEL